LISRSVNAVFVRTEIIASLLSTHRDVEKSAKK